MFLRQEPAPHSHVRAFAHFRTPSTQRVAAKVDTIESHGKLEGCWRGYHRRKRESLDTCAKATGNPGSAVLAGHRV